MSGHFGPKNRHLGKNYGGKLKLSAPMILTSLSGRTVISNVYCRPN